MTTQQSLSTYAISGGFGGFAVSHVLTPVELIKCRLQVQNTPGQPQLYSGPWDCIKQTMKSEGLVKGLFKGHTATMLREVPGNMAWFGVYEYLSMLFTPAGGTKDDLPGYMTAVRPPHLPVFPALYAYLSTDCCPCCFARRGDSWRAAAVAWPIGLRSFLRT